MRDKRFRILLIVACGVAILLIAGTLALPFLVDVNSYRATIETKAEEILGRDVRLGELSLSVFPLGVKVADVAVAALPEEGGGDLLAARSLRIGARVTALLRKRLEVTSVVLQEPSLVLERGGDGAWNVERLLPTSGDGAGDDTTAGPAVAVSVDRLRITGGRLVLRDARLGGEPREVVIHGLDVTVTDLALDREMAVKISANVGGAEVRLNGRAGPLRPPAGGALQVFGSLEVDELGLAELAALAGLADIEIPPGLLGESALSVAVEATGSFPSDVAAGPSEISIAGLAIRGLDLTLHRSAEGGWNFATLLGGDAGEPAVGASREIQLTIADLGIAETRVRLVDEEANLDVTLEELRVSLDRLPTEGPAEVEIASAIRIAGEPAGRLGVHGSLGPLGDGPTPADLRAELSGARLSVLGPYLEEHLGVGLTSGVLDVAVHVTGSPPERFGVSGTVSLSDVETRLAAPEGGERTIPQDVEVSYDIAIGDGGERLEFRSLKLNLSGDELRLTGRLDRSGPHTAVDVTLEPTKVMADHLAGLAVLADYELPVAFSSGRPLEISARVHGEIGGDAYPLVDGRLVLEDFSFRHPSLTQPLEQIRGTVELRGDAVEITGFAAQVGSSDVAGEISVQGFAKPRVRFDMRSRRAEFWELMSFVGGGEATAAKASSTGTSDEDGFLAGVMAEGRLRIDEGSFRTLDFLALDAGMRMDGQIITLDPFRMSLYGGTFQGAASLDLGREPTAFRLRSDVAGVDVNSVLADNLEMEGMLSGSFQGALEVQGTGADYESIVRSLSGGGSILVSHGRIGGLDMLDVLGDVSGVFGEQTLQSLSGRLAAEGTPFDRLAGSLRLAGGRMKSNDLVLESPDIAVKGTGDVDLMAATLDGDFQVIFSPEISRSMQAEGSRASQAFWDPSIDQVLLPLKLSGPFDAPSPSVDWGRAAENVARRELEKEVQKRLGDLGGLIGGGDAGQGVSSVTPSGDTPPPKGGDLVAEIRRVRWGGSFLLKDLKIEGVVRGSRVSHASLLVTDASGREMRRVDRLDEVERYFASGVDRTAPAVISWDSTVDGKKLIRADDPFTIILTVYDTEGRRVEARTEAAR